MLKEEFIQKSPVRIFEKSMEGGLHAGNIGILASKKGIGKTSVLVQIALDKLMQGEKVIHVSFNAHTSYIISWYENIFNEIARRKNLENIEEIKEQMIRNRMIMNFMQENISVDQILRTIKALMSDGSFNAKTLIIDGFEFTRATVERFEKVKAFLSETQLEGWYTCTLADTEPVLDSKGIPIVLRDIEPYISVIVLLEPKKDYIHLRVVKNHESLERGDMPLMLDPRTLLIAEA
jgi:KaiC/GvpD/RAD55 family RecA-like ATPase